MNTVREQAMRAFEEKLEALSGNDYDTYVSLCPQMEIVSESHLETPEKSARTYAALFGLHLLGKDTDSSERERTAIENRFISTLYAFAAGNPQSSWSLDGHGSICKVQENGTLKISIQFEDTDTSAPFILSKSDDFISSEEKKVGDLTVRNTDDLSFREIARDMDISGFVDYISPELSAELKASNPQKAAEKSHSIAM